MDADLARQEMATVAAAIASASHAQDREALMGALAKAIEALMSAYALLFAEVPAWGPESLRQELEQAIRTKRGAWRG
jgi:hypothetical protein